MWRPSATGLGTRPTVNGDGVTCETFIPDFSGDIYGDQSAGALLPFFVAHAEIRYAGGAFGHGGPRRAGRAGVAGEMSLRCYKPHKTWQNALFLRVRCVILFRLPYYGLQAYPGPVSGASLDGLPTLRLRQIIKRGERNHGKQTGHHRFRLAYTRRTRVPPRFRSRCSPRASTT